MRALTLNELPGMSLPPNFTMTLCFPTISGTHVSSNVPSPLSLTNTSVWEPSGFSTSADNFPGPKQKQRKHIRDWQTNLDELGINLNRECGEQVSEQKLLFKERKTTL